MCGSAPPRPRARMAGARRFAIAAYLLAAGLLAAPPTSGAATGPSLLVQPGSVIPGDQVLVTGDGLPPGVPVNVQVCGNGGVGGSGVCDLEDSTVASTDELGHFAQELTVNVPPAACPCVVQVVSPSLDSPVQGAITIVGAPTGPILQPVIPEPNAGLEVLSAHVVGGASWQEWFGAGPERTLVLTVANRSAQAIELPSLVLTSGHLAASRSGSPTASPATGFGSLAPGERRDLHVRIDGPPLSAGTLPVAGYFVGDRATTTFSAYYTSIPWGLAAVPVVAVFLVVALIDRWFRRRRAALRTRERIDAFVLSAMAARVRRLRPKAVPSLPPAGVPSVDRSIPLQTTVEEIRAAGSGVPAAPSLRRGSGAGLLLPSEVPDATSAPPAPVRDAGSAAPPGAEDTFFAAAPSRRGGRRPRSGRRSGP